MNLITRTVLIFSFFLGLGYSLYSQQIPVEHTPFCALTTVPMPAADISTYVKSMHRPYRRITEDSIILPVVIHNITWNQKGYVHNEKLLEWIANTNDALANRGSFYDPEGVDTKFRLCLAGVGPDGNPTSGIIHKDDVYCLHREIYFDNPHLYNTWDNSKYINVFVMEGVLGATRYPWNVRLDGLTVSSKAVESIQGVKILCHELGHYFGLLHTFEGCISADCLEYGDMVCDTRPEQLSFTRCQDFNSCLTDAYDGDPNNPFTEDGIDMDENYMDGGTCRTRFTAGQVDRMHWALDTYRMPDVDSLALLSLFSTCDPVLTDISFNDERGLVGEVLEIGSTAELIDVEYNWYVDNVWQSSVRQFEYVASTPGVKQIRLSLNNSNEDNCTAIWTTVKSLAFVCDAVSKKINIPDEIIVDSCYSISTTGFENLDWSYANKSGTGNNIEICPTDVGQFPLIINFGEGSCAFSDSIQMHVRDAKDKYERKYYQQEFADSIEYRKTLRIVQMERKTNGITAMFGEKYTNGESVDFWSADTSENFIAFWDDQIGNVEKWELYHEDTFSQALVSDFPIETNMQIHPKDWHLDSIGNIYFLASEQYARSSDVRGLIVGKINVIGQVEWCKRIYTPDFWADVGVNRTPAYIHKYNEVLTVAFHQVVLQMSTSGDLLKAKNIKTLPIERHPDGIYSTTVEFILSDSLIAAYGLRNRIEESKHTPGTDDLATARISQSYMAKIDLDEGINVLFSYDFPDVSVRPLRTVSHPKGYLRYWFAFHPDSTTVLSSTQVDNFYQHHLALFDYNGEMLWQRSYKDTNQESERKFHETNLFVLKNGEIIIVSGSDFRFDFSKNAVQGDNDYLRFDVDGTLIENRKYRPDGKSPRLGDNLAINQPSSLSNDGILVATHRRDSLTGRVFLQSIPLDGKNLICPTIDSLFVEVDSPPLVLDEEPLEMVVLDTEVRLEDVELHIRKSYTSTLTLCDSTHIIDDYSISSLDTTCISDNEFMLELNLCRELDSDPDTLLLSLYPVSPLKELTQSLESVEVYFAEGELCTSYTSTLSNQNYHIMLNAKPDYRSPFTLKKDFFDAAIHLEYDYTNNYAFIKACENSVSVSNLPLVHPLILTPNPANQMVTLKCGKNNISSYSLYSVLGSELIYAESVGRNPQINIRNLIPGAYIVVVRLENGYRQVARLVKN